MLTCGQPYVEHPKFSLQQSSWYARLHSGHSITSSSGSMSHWHMLHNLCMSISSSPPPRASVWLASRTDLSARSASPLGISKDTPQVWHRPLRPASFASTRNSVPHLQRNSIFPSRDVSSSFKVLNKPKQLFRPLFIFLLELKHSCTHLNTVTIPKLLFSNSLPIDKRAANRVAVLQFVATWHAVDGHM